MQAIKKGIASLLGISKPTALARPPATPTAVSTRTYISFQAIQALKEAPVGKAGLQAFRIQRHGECVQSSHDVKTSMISYLLQDGTMARNEPPQSFWGRLLRMMSWPQGELVPYEGPWTVDAIRALNARHGPLQIATFNLVQPGQGAEVYRRHHAAVLAACLPVDGRWIGVLVDGNDLQDNPAVEVLQAWRKAQHDRRPLHRLSRQDFEAASQSRGPAEAQQGLDAVDARQLGFRFVDLAQLLDSALRRACALAEQEVPEVLITQDDLTRHIFYDSTVHVSRPLLPPKVCDELAAAIRAEPALIEQFT